MQFEINEFCEDPLRLKWASNDFYDLPWESKEEELFPAFERTTTTTGTTECNKAATATATATDLAHGSKTPLRKGLNPYDLVTPASSCVSLSSFKDTPVFMTPMQPLYHHTPFATPIEKEALKTGSNPFYSPPLCMRSPGSPDDKAGATATAGTAAAAAAAAAAAGVGAAPVLGLCEAFSSRSECADSSREHSPLEAREFAPRFGVEPWWLSPPRSRTPSVACSLDLVEEEAAPPVTARHNSIGECVEVPDKPFACSECNKSFRRMEHLRRHTKIHTQERPFACEVFGCNRQFSRSDNLKAHLKTHAKRSGRNIYVEGFEAHVGAEPKVGKRRRRGRD